MYIEHIFIIRDCATKHFEKCVDGLKTCNNAEDGSDHGRMFVSSRIFFILISNAVKRYPVNLCGMWFHTTEVLKERDVLGGKQVP